MIRDLEQEWRVTLLIRDRGGVSLTSEGELLLPCARAMVRDYEKLQMQVDALSGLQSGLIRIGTFSSVATWWLPQIIRRFQQDYPAIDYELVLGNYEEIVSWVREGRVDCGFTRLPADPALEAISLAEDPCLAVLPQDHPLAGEEVFPVEALDREPFLLLENGGREEVSAYLAKNHLSPRIHFTTWDDYAVMAMVEQGLGIGILPQLILRRVPFRIRALPLSVPLVREIGLVLRSRQDASLATRRFLEYLQYR